MKYTGEGLKETKDCKSKRTVENSLDTAFLSDIQGIC